MVAAEENSIGIVGMTGGGKTTFGRVMAELVQARFFDELPVSENEFFEAFYAYLANGEKPNPAAFDEQKRFLDSALDISKEMKQTEREQTMWVMPPVGHFMYAFLLHEGGHLTDNEFVAYCDYYIEQIGQAITPNSLLVVLNGEAEVLQQRLQQRAQEEAIRENETQVDVGYWNDQYDYWRERLATQENYPLARLQEILSAELYEQFTQLAAIPMFGLFSDKMDWTTPDGAEQVRQQKLVQEFAIL